MALMNFARRTSTRLTSLLLRRLPPPPSSFPPPPYYSPSSSTITATPSTHSSETPIRTPVPSWHPPPYPPPSDDTSDFEEDSSELTFSADDPELRCFLDLIARAKGEEFSSKGEALAFLRASGVRPTTDLVFSALWALRRDWESGFLTLQWGEECVSGCPRAWHLMIWALGKQRRFDVAWSVLRRMRRWNMSARQGLVIIMERYVAANKVSKAIRTFHAMEKFKIFADSAVFYALLRALCKYKNVEEAEELLFIDRKLFPLETEGFNIILRGWCNTVDVAEAKRVWREMSSCCIYPDATSYTHMICCFSKVGNLFDTLRLYDEMKKRGWIPDIKVYNSLVHVLTRENCMKDAYAIFDKIKEVGLEANVDTYNSIICPLCDAQKLDEAHDILEKMVESGIEPNIDTYHAFAEVESMEGTSVLIERMKNAGCGPNSETFLLIFDKFLRLDQAGYALRFWSQMGMYTVTPDSSHYTALIKGLAACGWLPKAWEFYKDMKSKGFPADPKLEKLFKNWISSRESRRGRRDKQTGVPWVGGRTWLGERIFG